MVKTIVNTVLQGECGEEIQIQIIFLLLAILVCFILTMVSHSIFTGVLSATSQVFGIFGSFAPPVTWHGTGVLHIEGSR